MALLVVVSLSQIHYLCPLAWTDSVITFFFFLNPVGCRISDVCKIAPEQHELAVYIFCCL